MVGARVRSVGVGELSARLGVLDAVVAWLLNFGVPILAGVAWLASTGRPSGWMAHSGFRLAAVLLLAWWLRSVRKVRLDQIRELFTWSTKPVVVGIGVGLAFFVFDYSLVVGWQFIDRTPNLGDGTWNPWIATQSLADPYFAYFVALVLVGPLVEEFIHRGVAFPALARRLGVVAAAVVSSAVFALGHEYLPYSLATAFAAGLLYTWLTNRYQSLAPAIAAHMTVNFAVFATGWAFYNLFGIPGRIG
jgi:membrane protease YdiL (CAAX protease family)